MKKYTILIVLLGLLFIGKVIASPFGQPMSVIGIAGDLISTNNLSDVASPSTSATNLGLGATNDVTHNSITVDTVTGAGSAPVLSVCGTTPAITGFDLAGKVTIGTGVTTSCTVTFNVAYTNAPACVVTGDQTATNYATTTSTTVLTITSSADMDSDILSYICVGL